MGADKGRFLTKVISKGNSEFRTKIYTNLLASAIISGFKRKNFLLVINKTLLREVFRYKYTIDKLDEKNEQQQIFG